MLEMWGSRDRLQMASTAGKWPAHSMMIRTETQEQLLPHDDDTAEPGEH